jgi:hypothetical protein
LPSARMTNTGSRRSMCFADAAHHTLHIHPGTGILNPRQVQ